MLKPVPSHQFKKNLKKYQFKPTHLTALDDVLKLLLAETKLPEKYLDHPLSGNYRGYRECHLKPDTLLVYRTDDKNVYLARIGSHSELF